MLYRYPFVREQDALWLAHDCEDDVQRAGGYITVENTTLLVSLPGDIQPEHVGRLRLFRYEREGAPLDGGNKVA